MERESHWSLRAEKSTCRRPLMALTEMTGCGRWVCFGPQRQGFTVLIREQGKRSISRQHLVNLSDCDVRPTRKSQENVEQSDSGNQRKKKGQL